MGPHPLVIPGAVLLCGGEWWTSTMTTVISVGVVAARHMVFPVGLSLLATPLTTTALGCLSRELYGHGWAIMNTLQQLGGAPELAEVSGTKWAFVVGGLIALIPVISSPLGKPITKGDQRTNT